MSKPKRKRLSRKPAKSKLPLRDERGRFIKKPAVKPVKRKPVKPVKPPITRKPSKGFRRIKTDIADTILEDARRKIETALNEMSDGASSWAESSVSLAVNADGTIDGECRINGISRSISVDEFLLELEAFAKAVYTASHLFTVLKNDTTTWAALVVIRPAANDDETGLIGGHGKELVYASTYWRKALTTQIGLIFLAARAIVEGWKGKRRKRVETILYRLHWNAQGVQP